MEQVRLVPLTRRWRSLTDRVLDLAPLSADALQTLCRDTYRALSVHCKEERIPKELAKTLLAMETFLSLSSLMEEKEKGRGFYLWEELFLLIEALKRGFFDGKYPHAYPVLEISDLTGRSLLFNLETDGLTDYAAALRTLKTEAP